VAARAAQPPARATDNAIENTTVRMNASPVALLPR
jgi:hypothetical protein